VEESLGEDISKWQRMLLDISRARATFDTSSSSKQFGPVTIHFEQVHSSGILIAW
jgi:dynein heavy chain 1